MGKAARKKKKAETYQAKSVLKKKSSPFFHTLVILLIIFAAAAFQRNAVWKDGVKLWEDVVSQSPNKAGGIIILEVKATITGLIRHGNEYIFDRLKTRTRFPKGT